MKALTLLTVLCWGLPNDNVFMLGQRASPWRQPENKLACWRPRRICSRAGLTTPTDTPTGWVAQGLRQKMDAFLLETSLLLLAAICKLEHVLDDVKVSLNVLKIRTKSYLAARSFRSGTIIQEIDLLKVENKVCLPLQQLGQEGQCLDLYIF